MKDRDVKTVSDSENPIKITFSEPRDVSSETDKVQIGKSVAQSSHKALYFHLLDPDFVRRTAKRMTVGGDKFGWVQWRQGINDVEYVTDRYNHLWDHLLCFQEDGNTKDDNLSAIAWAVNCLMAAERLCPEVVKQVIGTCKLFGATATDYHKNQFVAKSKEKQDEKLQSIAENKPVFKYGDIKLPLYYGSKRIGASRIEFIDCLASGYCLHLVQGDVLVTAEWFYKNHPNIGGYFVVREDGSAIFSPPYIFEKNNELVR